jgi:hypothetical protein
MDIPGQIWGTALWLYATNVSVWAAYAEVLADVALDADRDDWLDELDDHRRLGNYLN